jgi:hypothetical protein
MRRFMPASLVIAERLSLLAARLAACWVRILSLFLTYEWLLDPQPGILYPRLIEASGRCP